MQSLFMALINDIFSQLQGGDFNIFFSQFEFWSSPPLNIENIENIHDIEKLQHTENIENIDEPNNYRWLGLI